MLAILEVAKSQSGRPAFINGVSAITHTVFMGDRMGTRSDTEFADQDGLHMAGHECYTQAGITQPLRQVQLAELYDPFSSFQFPQLESLGFCRRGEAQTINDQNGFEIGGLVAVNPSGGTLCANPIGVTGLVRVADAALQVMGRAGAAQVPGVSNAIVTAVGGSTQFFTCTALGDDHV